METQAFVPKELCGLGDAERIDLLPGMPPRLRLVVRSSSGLPLEDELEEVVSRLRAASSRSRVRDVLGVDAGFRIEDVSHLVASVRSGDDVDAAQQWLRRRFSKEAVIPVPSRGDAVTLSALLHARPSGGSPLRPPYAVGADARVRVEAFELHVTEHCNLRCANCCNLSPLVPKHTLTVEETASLCQRMASVLVADVFKIMGGEPLLHPDIAGVLAAVRSSGISDKVRLFTNGLLLGSAPNAFWAQLDELTISNYVSAPVKPAVIARAKEASRRYGFVLNVKPVNEFSQVLSPERRDDVEQVRGTFRRCWLRHRCLVVRRGRFFMCTRAAYAPEFMQRACHDAVPNDWVARQDDDGIRLDEPDLPTRIADYMNRTEPLRACTFCFGGEGATEEHYQLRRTDVENGLISRSLKPKETV